MDDTPLSLDALREACGDDDVAQLEKLELIFSRCTSLAHLERTPRLRDLTAIDTGLVRVGSVAPVGHSLTSLTLIDQTLTHMEALPLPQLKRLCLQNNRIERIAHLDTLPRLEVLWLNSNRITSLQGLESAGNLRELWLAENRITCLGTHLASLARLETLNLAGNAISDYSDIQSLGSNPRLRSLRLDDAHFGPNPVVRAEGYRTFSICYLPQLEQLDGRAVDPGARDAARAEFTREVLAFNARVEAVQKEHEREYSAIAELKSRSNDSEEKFQDEVRQVFGKLQQLVLEGRAAVSAEHERQARVREENLKHLEAELLVLQKSFNRDIDRRIDAEARSAADEERVLREAEAVATRELAQSTLLAGLPDVAAQHLGSHTPDMQHLSREFRLAAKLGANARGHPAAGDAPSRTEVLRCYRVHHIHQTAAFEKWVGAAEERAYLALPIEQSGLVLQQGIGVVGGAHGAQVTMYSDPELAVRLGATNGEAADATAVVACRMRCPADAVTFSADAPRNAEEALALMAQLPAGAATSRVNFVGQRNSEWLDAGEEENESGVAEAPTSTSSHAWIVGAEGYSRALPEFHLLVGRSPGDPRKLATALESYSLPIAWACDGEGLVEQVEAEASAKIREYMERVWEETNPTSADQLREIDEAMRARVDAVGQLRAQIQGERTEQEELLRGLRLAEVGEPQAKGLSAGSGMNGTYSRRR